MTEVNIIDANPYDDVLLNKYFDMLDASWRESLPGFPLTSRPKAFLDMIRSSPDTTPKTRLAMVDGNVVGATTNITFPNENTHLLEFELDVDPRWRRQGIGTALYNDTIRMARETGRRTLHVYAPTNIQGGAPRSELPMQWAERNGFTAGLLEVRRSCDLRAADNGRLDELLAAAWAKADGFELRQWSDTAPDDLVADIAYLDGRLMQDAPMGTLDIEPQKVDVDRIRQRERSRRTMGCLRLYTGVVHRDTGRLAGFTGLVSNPGDEEHAWQGITIVDPNFRGHRIGTILKIENHRLLASYRPRMRYIHTWNANANDHMISINDAVGFRVADGWTAFEKQLDAPSTN